MKNSHEVSVKEGEVLESSKPLANDLNHDMDKQWQVEVTQFDHKRFISVFEKKENNWHFLFVYIQGSQAVADKYRVSTKLQF